MATATQAPYGRKTQRKLAVKEVHVLWITAGLSCDGDSVSTTAATQPSIEDIVMDPPEPFAQAAAACKNIGAWPVLAGQEGQKDTMLSSPIILYDYPQLVPESPGDLFDGTEIDELLTLRIITLTDEEKAVMAAVDERASDLLRRTLTTARANLSRLHGTFRGLREASLEGQE